jgi:integrase
MRLEEFLELYLESHQLGKDTAKLVRRSIHYCMGVVGNAEVTEIREIDLVRIKTELDKSGYPSRSANALKWLKILLTEAWRLRLVEDPPRFWPKQDCRSKRLPDSWSEEDAGKLLGVASAMPGAIYGIPAGLWWRSWLLVAWDCALRASQVFRLRWEDVAPEFSYIIVRSAPNTKSYRDQLKPITKETASALRDMAEISREGPLFPFPDWPKSRRDFFSLFRCLCYLADIPVPRSEPLQLSHKLRRTSITMAALQSLEAAKQHAGHTNLRTTLEHYVDPRRLAQEPPKVPPLKSTFRVIG